MQASLIALQARLQYTFSNISLLQRAVTHRSFSADHNERLEFLGDSVLSLAVSTLLFQKLSSLPEGDLSRVRANLVKQEPLHQLALRLNLPEVIRLGEGEARSGGKKRPSILADTVEALIGAVYLDSNYARAEALVHHLYESVEINPHMQAVDKDPKTALQEQMQGKKMKLPLYRVVATAGAAHLQTFTVECEIAEFGQVAQGTGASRRAAEQAAAAAMLAQLKAKK